MYFVLYMILTAQIGVQDPLVIKGSTYSSLDDCMRQGNITSNWLAQDFVTVKWICRRTDEERQDDQDKSGA